MNSECNLETKTLAVDVRNIGKVTAVSVQNDVLDDVDIHLDPSKPDARNLLLAAEQLKTSDIPVAFPTETVYGLGADATRSAAVNGIYKAKQRPADNPLIVHFASLKQLRELLKPSEYAKSSQTKNHATNGFLQDPIPEIYKPLISKFWPGPLTIILSNPPKSPLAPEVTAGLNTFGARIPRHVLALALIRTSDRPIAAPSANASTKPSPTAAEHVAYDLDGRIETILDGGPCDVGVESTVVDGLSQPPLILRPGGISIEQLRSCPGWENTQIGYKSVSESGSRPKAPGMKYRHYSPIAPVFLFEPRDEAPALADMYESLGPNKKFGVITTKLWDIHVSKSSKLIHKRPKPHANGEIGVSESNRYGFAGMIDGLYSAPDPRVRLKRHSIQHQDLTLDLLVIALGRNTADIARGIFSALRELDTENVDAIFIEGIEECEGDTAAAVMNRLRKAAETKLAD